MASDMEKNMILYLFYVVVVVVILMAFLANLYPLRQLLYGYPILLYGVMLSIACACACLLKWEETGVPGGNPRKHGENMQTPHRKAGLGRKRTQDLLAVRQQR